MRLTTRELMFVKNILMTRRSYKYTVAPLGVQSWEPWMEALLTKVTDELEV
tara:strand:- start:626 stop:778 length:153 start_codon:yes stop_codon:yes gene_type:complete